MLSTNVTVTLILPSMIWKMTVILSFSSVHRRRKPVSPATVSTLRAPDHSESGLILTASTVVLTDQRITHVGDPRAVETSCTHVELVDISSNGLSDWQEVRVLIDNHVRQRKDVSWFRSRFFFRRCHTWKRLIWVSIRFRRIVIFSRMIFNGQISILSAWMAVISVWRWLWKCWRKLPS